MSNKTTLCPLNTGFLPLFLWIMTLSIVTSFCFTGIVHAQVKNNKPRIIVTTDGESDDKCSFVRYLIYSNDFNTEGLIYVNSKHHPNGEGIDWIEAMIDAYAEVYPNLLLHDPDYPLPEDLISVVKVGNLTDQNMHAVGPDKDTPGSDWIVSVLLKQDSSPLWILCWGGINTVAQALYRIKESYPDQVDNVTEKTKIHAIAGQENEADGPSSYDFVGSEFPEMFYIQEWQYMAIAYDHRRNHKLGNSFFFSETWLTANVKSNHGPLGASYVRKKVLEGDSPSFIYLIPTGLRNIENPSYGGWGGRYEKKIKYTSDSYWPNADPKNLDAFRSASHGSNNFWTDALDDGDRLKPIWRWIIPMGNDFEARMDWCVKDFGNANHPPLVNLDHAEDMTVNSGDTVRLSAVGTQDPDGDNLYYEWWQYNEPGSYNGFVKITNASGNETQFIAPKVTEPETVHIILDVTDNGKPNLTRYRRVIVTVLP